MKIHADCVPCLMKRVLFQSRLVDEADDFAAVSDSLRAFSQGISRDRKSVDVATEVHRACYSALGCDDPYLDLKIGADDVASRFMDAAEGMVDASDDKLRTALMVSVAGNIMDFGSGIAIDDPHDFEDMFDDLVSQGLGLDQTDLLERCLRTEGSVVYMFDNCGESQLDRILIRYLRGMGKRVVGVVRGAPILNDVTESDARRSGLYDDLDLLLTTGTYYIGIDMDGMPAALRDEIERSCVVIAKGMANFESLSDEVMPVPVAHILRAKCKPVADALGVAVGTNVVRVRMVEEVLL